uniref:G-protein coupled receptor family C group 6 member A n=1 Tax=Denticeps clupeoides TaxID=299321 RepID=A0AAY4AJD0_9TELE
MTYVVRVMCLCMVLVLDKVEGGSLRTSLVAAASAPGDIIIGGLFPIHNGVTKSSGPLLETPTSLAMIQAVEEANSSSMLGQLGIKLGYEIYDTCSDVSTALRATAKFMEETLDCEAGNRTSGSRQPTMAVIGASSSEVSIAVARQLSLQLIPQISYSSTATILSDKLRFPTFMRTVPSDLYQTRAMVRLVKDSGWNWVGIIINEGDYGRSAQEMLSSEAAANGICVAFKEVLPDSVTDPSFNSSVARTINIIHRNPKVKAIISFAKPTYMKHLFKALEQTDAGRRVWIASDIWSTSGRDLHEINFETIGQVVGVTFIAGDSGPVTRYLEQLDVCNKTKRNYPFLTELCQLVNGTVATQELINSIRKDTVFSLQMAVSTVLYAVADLYSQRKNCTTCDPPQPWQLLAIMNKTTFEYEGAEFNFDENGDLNLGYHVSIWKTSREEIDWENVVATYDQKKDIIKQGSTDDVISKCSNSCAPGQFKKSAEGQHICCYDCVSCPQNQYSNVSDMDLCFTCSEKEWSEPRSSACKPKTVEYFDWIDGFAIFLVTLAALGILIVLLVSILFLCYRHTPVVKASGGPLCQVILFSLLGSFTSAICFVGRPGHMQCKMRQVLFGLSFTLCVSCILVKSLKILLAFHFNPEVKAMLRRLYKPHVIVCTSVGIQVLICVLWLVLKTPYCEDKPESKIILVQCVEGSDVAFGVMLGYIGILALVCFGFAFKSRKLPTNYNEAKFITFGMLIYIISWVIFIPTYVNTSGKYQSAVEMVVILISTYGIVGCHFMSKCYLILFKKESNTKHAFLQNVYEYSQKQSDSFFDSNYLSVGSLSVSKLSVVSPTVNMPQNTGSCPNNYLHADVIKATKEQFQKLHLCKEHASWSALLPSYLPDFHLGS